MDQGRVSPRGACGVVDVRQDVVRLKDYVQWSREAPQVGDQLGVGGTGTELIDPFLLGIQNRGNGRRFVHVEPGV